MLDYGAVYGVFVGWATGAGGLRDEVLEYPVLDGHLEHAKIDDNGMPTMIWVFHDSVLEWL